MARLSFDEVNHVDPARQASKMHEVHQDVNPPAPWGHQAVKPTILASVQEELQVEAESLRVLTELRIL